MAFFNLFEHLKRLRLDSVFRAHDERRNIGHICAVNTNITEGLMSRGIKKCNVFLPAVFGSMDALIGVNMLSNASRLREAVARSRLGSGHIGFSDVINERRLAMVYVSQDGHHWRTNILFSFLF